MSQTITGITSRELFDAIGELELEDSVSLLKIFDRALLNEDVIKRSFSFLREEEEFISRMVYVEFTVYGDNSEDFLWKIIIH